MPFVVSSFCHYTTDTSIVSSNFIPATRYITMDTWCLYIFISFDGRHPQDMLSEIVYAGSQLILL